MIKASKTGLCFGRNFSIITSYVTSCQKVPFFSWNVKCWFYFPWTVKGPNYFPWNVIFTLLPPVLFHPQCKTSFSFGLVMIHRWTQLFRVRLSYERGRAYATMSKVIIGNSGFTVALLNLRCFSVVEGKSNDQRLCHGDTDDSRESGNSYAINSSHTVQNQFTITIHKVR